MISLILQKKIMEKYRDAKNIAGVWTAATGPGMALDQITNYN